MRTWGLGTCPVTSLYMAGAGFEPGRLFLTIMHKRLDSRCIWEVRMDRTWWSWFEDWWWAQDRPGFRPGHPCGWQWPWLNWGVHNGKQTWDWRWWDGFWTCWICSIPVEFKWGVDFRSIITQVVTDIPGLDKLARRQDPQLEEQRAQKRVKPTSGLLPPWDWGRVVESWQAEQESRCTEGNGGSGRVGGLSVCCTLPEFRKIRGIHQI